MTLNRVMGKGTEGMLEMSGIKLKAKELYTNTVLWLVVFHWEIMKNSGTTLCILEIKHISKKIIIVKVRFLNCWTSNK